jgi:hypothetical protein
VFGMCKVQTFG